MPKTTPTTTNVTKTMKFPTPTKDVAKTVENIETEKVSAPIVETVATPVAPSSNDEMALLKLQIQMLQEALGKLSVPQPQQPIIMQNTMSNPNEARIPIMSLYYGVLNLKTDNTPTPNIITFTQYGEILLLSSIEVSNILRYNKKFAEEGYFYILDKKVVEDNFFSLQYKRLLPDEVISQITRYNELELPKILANITDTQKDTIAKMLSEKIAYEDPDVDLNKVGIIGNCIDRKITAMADQMSRVLYPERYKDDDED